MRIFDNVPVILHADDYGETYNTCVEMIELMKGGHLDGISLLTNMREYERYLNLLIAAVPGMPFLPLINIHINLVEGRRLSLAAPDDTGLVDAPCTRWTWMNLCRTSFHLPAYDTCGNGMKYREVYRQLVDEIKAQLLRGADAIAVLQKTAMESGISYTPQNIRIDSHQHAHMIPVVRRALTAAIRETGMEVDYIRNSHELLVPFLKHKSTVNMIGVMKNRILALFASGMERYIRSLGLTPSYLCGVMMSGHMDAVRLMTVMPDILERCRKKGFGLEINIHPAMMLETEVTEEIPMESAQSFYMSSDRHMEALTVRTIRAAMIQQFGDSKTGNNPDEVRS
ncbi:MAG: ChbG/HpnK family deacetylase [Lachnospiraceae bacterium]|nr:ChbG/HpnK family deacetylase [Lachnospiraceae bacterium]MBQ8947901.1 ChbG/HpnK family deacetylase [Lachnospiraceae bacterium]